MGNNQISQKQEVLKKVQAKLESDRDELVDLINSTLNYGCPTRISVIYEAELKLSNIEKALEINRYFMIQLQQDILTDILADDMVSATLKSIDRKQDENIEKISK